MPRHKDRDWNVGDIAGSPSWEQVNASLLMDIRDELKALNAHMKCFRWIRALNTLERIDRRLREGRKLRRGRKR